MGYFVKTIARLKTDIEYKRKLCLTAALCLSYVVLGWSVLQYGTALPDLQVLIGVDLEAASWLFTTRSIGYVIGCVISGWLFDRYDRVAIMLAGSLGTAICAMLTPYILDYQWAIVMRAVTGIWHGTIDTGANAIVPSIWESKNGPYMQALYLFYAIGGVLAPFITEPFMLEHTIDDTFKQIQNYTSKSTELAEIQIRSSTVLVNTSFEEIPTATFNVRNTNEVTDLKYAFVITAIVALLSCLPYLIMFYKGEYDQYGKTKQRMNVVTKEKQLKLEHVLVTDVNANSPLYDKLVTVTKDYGEVAMAIESELIETARCTQVKGDLEEPNVDDMSETSEDTEIDVNCLPCHVTNTRKNSLSFVVYEMKDETKMSLVKTAQVNEKDRSNISYNLDEKIKHEISEEQMLEVDAELLLKNVTASSSKSTEKKPNISRIRLGIVLLCIAMVNLIYEAAEDTFSSYIVTFCVDYLDWDTENSAALSSLYWAFGFVGGISGIILVQLLKTTKLLYLTHLTWLFGFLGILLGSIFHCDTAIWICTTASGFVMVQIIPASISWIEENVCTITGGITSLIMVATGSGLIVNPLFIGYMMQSQSFLYFMYILVLECVVCFVFYFVGDIYRRRI